MASEEVQPLIAEDFVFVKVDVQRDRGGQEMLDRLRGDAPGGLPWFVFLEPDGTRVADSNAAPGGGNLGCPDTEDEVEAFGAVLRRARLRLTDEEIAAIVNAFHAHGARGRRAKDAAGVTADYPIRPVEFHRVHFDGGFWGPRLKTNREVTLPYCLRKCEETGRLANFRVAGGLEEGAHQGRRYNDSDVFKVMEGAAYALATQSDPELEATLDEVISWFAAAQEEDGYLYTARTIDPENLPPNSGPERWSFLQQSHELYNLGHMFEAAVAHHRVTGKTNFLDVAVRAADLLVEEFGPGKRVAYPGHQEVEIGLAKLARVTGEPAYLDLAKWFLDVRGTPAAESADSSEGLKRYLQSHRPPLEQEQAVGHAVRAAYMYSAMADVAAMTGAPAYREAAERIWRDVTHGKLYVTGGIGSSRSGEAFGEPFELPNESAYAETCASIANALWNHRMFLLSGEARYLDVLERTVYNGFLAGVSLEGDRFFYPNPLACDGTHAFNQGETGRAPWFSCSCCPVNVVRFLPSLPGMQYAVRERDLYVCLYQQGSAEVEIGGRTLTLRMDTRYPWDGAVRLSVVAVEGGEPLAATLRLRVPGWARGEPVPGGLYRDADVAPPAEGAGGAEDVSFSVHCAADPKAVTGAGVEDGFLTVEAPWAPGDAVELQMPMPVRLTAARPEVEADRGRRAVERGPLVYCAEGVDHGGRVADLVLGGAAEASVRWAPELLGGVQEISLPGRRVLRAAGEGAAETEPATLQLVPYYAWAHRGAGAMAVWLAAEPGVARPRPQPTLASRAKVSASHCFSNDSPEAVHDRVLPESSADAGVPRHTWWPRRGTEEWLQYELAEPATLAGVRVYWFDDTGSGGCRVPAAWTVQVRGADGAWSEVEAEGAGGTARDAWNVLRFAPLRTGAVRLVVQLQDGRSAGVLEWELLEPPG